MSSDERAAGGAVEITFLIDNDEQTVKEAEQLAKDSTAKNPNITIKLETRPEGTEGDNIVKTRLSTGDMTDIFKYNTGSLFQAIEPGEEPGLRSTTSRSSATWTRTSSRP